MPEYTISNYITSSGGSKIVYEGGGGVLILKASGSVFKDAEGEETAIDNALTLFQYVQNGVTLFIRIIDKTPNPDKTVVQISNPSEAISGYA